MNVVKGCKMSLRVDKKVKANAEAGLLTKYVAAALFHLFTFCSNCAALGYQYTHVPKCIKKYYLIYSESMFWGTPVIMIVFNFITFIFFILGPPIYVLHKRNPNKYGYKLIYSMVSPFSCIASFLSHCVCLYHQSLPCHKYLAYLCNHCLCKHSGISEIVLFCQ